MLCVLLCHFIGHDVIFMDSFQVASILILAQFLPKIGFTDPVAQIFFACGGQRDDFRLEHDFATPIRSMTPPCPFITILYTSCLPSVDRQYCATVFTVYVCVIHGSSC